MTIGTISVASTPGRPTMKMSPFNEFTHVNKVRSRSVSDRKDTFSEKPAIETGAPPDVVQLRQHEISTNYYAQLEVDDSRNNNESNIVRNGEMNGTNTKEKFVPKNSDDTRIITSASQIEVQFFQANDQNTCVESGNDTTNGNDSKSRNVLQQSKLPRPTTIGSLKNPHLPAANNNVPLHTEKNQTGPAIIESNENCNVADFNNTSIAFEDLHCPKNQKFLIDQQANGDGPRHDIQNKKVRLEIDQRPRPRKNSHIDKLEDDNANLSDEGIIIGDNNSNANSEASNSPLPPSLSNTDPINIGDGNCSDPRNIKDETIITKGAILEENANCDQSRIDSKQDNKFLNLMDDSRDHSKMSSNRKHSSTDNSNLNRSRNKNNNETNISNPQMSSPCDDRVPSRIPLSVE